MRILEALRTRALIRTGVQASPENDKPRHCSGFEPLAYSKLLSFFLPLAATPLMAYSTHNIIHAALARLPVPHLSLAAFTVVRAASDAIKAPVLVSGQISASLVDSRRSYVVSTSFVWALAGGFFVVLAGLGYTHLGSLFLYEVIGLRDPAVVELGQRAFRIFAFLPLVEVLRHSNRGLLIAHQRTGIVSTAMLIRMLILAVFVVWTVSGQFMDGIDVAAFAWTGGLAIEGVILLIAVCAAYKTPIRAAQTIPARNDRDPTLRYVIGFFVPLAVMITVREAVQPLIQAGIARGAGAAVHQLAVYGVAWSLVLNIVAPLRMLHNCAIVYAPSRDHSAWPRVLRFCTATGAAMTATLVLLAVTPIGYQGLRYVLGVSPSIARDANLVILAFAPFPVFWGRREAYWGVMMRRHRTRAIAGGKLIHVLVLLVTMALLFGIDDVRVAVPPAVIGAAAFTLGEVAETVFICRLTAAPDSIPGPVRAQ